MCISTSAAFGFWDESLVLELADKVGRVADLDPRCVFCTLAAALIIRRYLQFRSGLINDVDIDAAVEEAFSKVTNITAHISVIRQDGEAKTV
jgi:hypothetical protein